MVGAHCHVEVGAVLKSIEFYFPFEVQWLVNIGWLPGATKCFMGGLI